MKVPIKDSKNNEKGKKDLPRQFDEQIRTDLIKRAVLSFMSKKRQPYGTDPLAGKRASAWISKRRKDYKTSYGHGISRSPRKILSRSGSQFNWVGAFAPNTVGGRRAHPPKANKIWEEKINSKEKKKALRSALAATISKEIVRAHGHIVPEDYPFVISNEFEQMKKAKEVVLALKTLGLTQELLRCRQKIVRAGKGKARNRPYKRKVGLLLVVSEKSSLINIGKNIPGIDIVSVKTLNAKDLAPGAVPGRLTLFTENAIDTIEKERMFT
ncbi:MAG: 50S ribosomal protein L4 [Candidatus Woesearchaeota archaeon]